MKKLLLILPLVLMGCFHATWNDPAPVKSAGEEGLPVAAQIARGTNGMVEWRCSLETYTEGLAWVQCDFTNKYSIPALSGCTKVGFWSETDGRLVVEGNRVCSGDLMPGATTTRYVAFQKEKRQTLRKCGDALQSCVMLAGNSPE